MSARARFWRFVVADILTSIGGPFALSPILSIRRGADALERTRWAPNATSRPIDQRRTALMTCCEVSKLNVPTDRLLRARTEICFRTTAMRRFAKLNDTLGETR